VTSFFVPGTDAGTDADRAHAAMRAATEARTGRATRPARIYALSCRREGADTETRVGARDPLSGETVRAIFANPEGFTVIWQDGHADLDRHSVYEAIPFSARPDRLRGRRPR
jgi:hypothetical protein